MGKHLSDFHKAAISKANTGRLRTEKEKIAAKNNGIKMSGDNHWTRRIGISNSTRNKISESLSNYYLTHKQHEGTGKKAVLCVETNQVFDSIEGAAKYYSICRSLISEVASGKRKTANGKHWKFVESLETSRKT